MFLFLCVLRVSVVFTTLSDVLKIMMFKKILKIGLVGIITVFLIGFMIPERLIIPVRQATPKDWNHQTFWFSPWGSSGVHKGIDIFAPMGQPVLSATSGIVISTGILGKGGNIIAILGPKWRIHYYAHLNRSIAHTWHIVSSGEIIGEVGDTGNAKGKPPHLHYSVITLLPYFWRMDDSMQGWEKMFFLNPHQLLMKTAKKRT